MVHPHQITAAAKQRDDDNGRREAGLHGDRIRVNTKETGRPFPVQVGQPVVAHERLQQTENDEREIAPVMHPARVDGIAVGVLEDRFAAVVEAGNDEVREVAERAEVKKAVVEPQLRSMTS